MALTEEEIERIRQHRDNYSPSEDTFEQLEGFQNLHVETNGTSYNFSYGDVSANYRAKGGAKQLFAEVLWLMSESQPLGSAILESDYRRTSRTKVRRTLTGFTDQDGYLLDGLEDDFSKLADEILG